MKILQNMVMGVLLFACSAIGKGATTPVYELSSSGLKPGAESVFEYQFRPVDSTDPQLFSAESWQLSRDGHHIFQDPDHRVWIHYQVLNTGTPEHWVIYEQGNYDHQEVQFVVRHADGRMESGASGTMIPPHLKSVQSRYVASAFALGTGEKADLFIGLHTTHPIKNNFRIVTAPAFERLVQESQVFFGFFFGVLLLACAMYLMFWVCFRDRTYLYYVCFCGAFCLTAFTNSAFWTNYLWPYLGVNAAISGHWLSKATVVLPVVPAILFSLRFLEMKQRLPRVFKVARWVAMFAVGVMIMQALDVSRSVETIFLPAVFLGTILLLLGSSLVVVWQGYRPGIVYAMGWGCLFAATLTWLLENFDVIPATFFTLHAPYFGEIVEIVLISLAIAQRIAYLQKAELEAVATRTESENVKLLLRVVSHDLKNQVAVVSSWVQAAESAPDDAARQKLALSKVGRSAKRLSSILDHVRTMRALADNKQALELGPVNLHRVMQLIEETFEEPMRTKNLSLDIDHSNFEGVHVLAEESSLCHQVVSNIVSNAVKFSPEGRSISLKVQKIENRVALDIIDQGVGIPADIRDALFDQSRPTTRSGTSGERGTGYGMPLVKAYMDRYGATISLESRDVELFPETHGTTVRLIFETAAVQRPIAK